MAHAPAKKDGLERLRRDTPFLCDFAFHVGVPDVAVEAKLLVPPLDTQQLAAFQPSSFADYAGQSSVFDQVVDVGVLETDLYRIPATPQPLAPEDAALLDDEPEEALGASPDKALAKGPKQGEVSWLMRTTYISGAAAGPQRAAPKGAPKGTARPDADAAAPQGVESQEEAVLASFEAAMRPPVHPTRPELQAVEVLPVLPDVARWLHQCVLATFDSEPGADLRSTAGLGPAQLRRLAERAVMKSYNIQNAAGLDQLIAFMLPRSPEPGPEEALGEASALEWAREYSFRVHRGAEAGRGPPLLLRRGGDGPGPGAGAGAAAVHYTTLGMRLTLQRRARQISMGAQRPVKVTLKRRRATAEERGRALKRLKEGVGLEAEDPQLEEAFPALADALAA